MSDLRARGLLAVSRIGFNGVKEDPVHFALLVSRRFASSRLFLGITKRIGRLLEAHKLSNFAFTKRVRSSIFLLDGKPNEAIELLKDQHDAKSMCARARIYAFLGEYEFAVAQAASAGKAGRRLVKQYAAEKSVLSKPLIDQDKTLSVIRTNHKRVLHLLTNSLPFTNSGYTQRSHSVLKSIQKTGWEVVPFSRVGYPWIVGVLPNSDADDIDGVTYRRLLPKVLPATATERLSVQTELLSKAVVEFKPAVLHTTTEFLNGISIKDVAQKAELPWIYEVRGQLADTWLSGCADRSRESFRYINFKARESEIAKSADAVITLGSTMRDELIAAGVDPQRILICPNAVGEEFIENVPDKSTSRQKLGLADDWQLIGTVSSLVGYEGLDLLVRAFAELSSNHPKLRLVIVGDGTERTSLINLADELGIKDRAVFPGRVEKSKARLYHRALDVFVVPRRDLDVTRAVTPLKPVEAMAFEVPVVATDLPALREIVDDGVDGLLFEAGDQFDLADKIRVLLDDKAMRDTMGRAGRMKVLSTRTWAANAEKITSLYSSLCAGRSEQ
ncbi:glycosyltransferase WbuB [Arthrobacter sp. MYb211]|uniref:glycosyltransferase family 4 protein n=1 Tax=Micrococcaceae TaxID=1268 RepID=UPI000CFD9616|nr:MULTISPECIES: glycosyltransferase family 4 protein [unclassified Arthrobacter]PRA14103.1 glycosyltransferase WbuB [Arthrobacter sp. MYb221]PRC06539.1 glycosyltransferase WbuB [Arthrobacter sp. MYb211]